MRVAHLHKCWVVFAVMALASCSAEDVPEGAVFRYNEASGITSLDPAFARMQSNIWAVNQLFDGLVALDTALLPQPAIAKTWEIGADARTYKFALRTDVFFHHHKVFGTAKTRRVVANDFVYTLQRLADGQLAAPGAWITRPIDTVFALGTDTLVVVLKAPFPPFLSLMAMPYAFVVPQEVVAFCGPTFGQQPIGTGPFYLKRWVENEKMVLRKNNHYHQTENGAQLPYLEAISIRFIPDKQAAFMEFVKGNLDFLSGLDAAYKDELLQPDGNLQVRYANKFDVATTPYLNTEYLGFLMDTNVRIMIGNPLLDVRVRMAINYGFDRAAMIRYLRNNIGTPATAGMVPPGLPGSLALGTGFTYNPERAAALLREAGFPNGKGLPEIVLHTNAGYLDLCEFLQAQLKQLGIRIKIDVSPPSTLRQGIATSKVPFFRASWIADYGDAENYLALFYSQNFTPNGPNYTHFSNPQFDVWFEQAQQEVDGQRRYQLYQQMDSLVMAAAPVVPLFYDQVIRFYPKGLKGLNANAMNLLDLRRVQKSTVLAAP